MPLTLLGVLAIDPDSSSLSLTAPSEEYLLVVKDSNGDYRALGVSEHGKFKGEVQYLLEDDVLEGYMPDTAFFKLYVADNYKDLRLLLQKEVKEADFPKQIKELLDALLALASGSKPKAGTDVNLNDVRQLLEDIDLKDPTFEFVCALANAAIRHRKNNNHDQAIFYYMKAMDIGGEDPNILFNLARVYHDLGAIERAKQSLKRALEIEPGMEMARKFLSFFSTKK